MVLTEEEQRDIRKAVEEKKPEDFEITGKLWTLGRTREYIEKQYQKTVNFRNGYRPFCDIAPVIVRPLLFHIPQMGQRAGHQFVAGDGGRCASPKESLHVLLMLEPLNTLTRPLTLLRPYTSP